MLSYQGLGEDPGRQPARGQLSMGQAIWGFYIVILNNLIDIYLLVVIVGVILSWLISFNVVNTRNQFVAAVARITYQLTEPALRPIRRILPSFGGLDFSPVVLILGLIWINDYILSWAFGNLAQALS